MRTMLLSALLLATPLLSQADSASNLVVNGSFESVVINSSNRWDIFSNISGWTGGSAGIEVRNNAVGLARDGVNFVELDTTANSSMFQTVATQAGQRYTLSFFYADRIGNSQPSNGLDWSLDGSHWNAVSSGTGGNSHDWKQLQFDFNATGATTLYFRATGTSDQLGTSLDQVSITTAVPEPQSAALLLGGLAALGFLARRRRLS